ncbi:MAG: hypothetical protein KIT48_02040 [Pseudolabrys sp.]|nr:hypothetical protein [Pseudolabrys sp.]
MASTPASIPAPKSANENSTLRRDAAAAQVAEDDYQSFCEALGASARGRAFLAEYARRNRHADTEVVLEALSRLEETARTHKPAAEADRIRQDLRALLDTLRTAKPQTENSPSAIKAATLSALIDFTQARLEALVTMPDDLRALEALAAVPPPEQPELPIPQPLAAAPAAPVVLMQPAAEAPKAKAEKTDTAETLAARLKSSVAPDAIGIPKVEFDYQAQLSTRPAARVQAEAPVIETAAAWSELSPPPVEAPPVEARVESSPASAPADVAPTPVEAESKAAPAPQGKIEPGRVFKAGEVETYELWLDDLTVEVTETIAAEPVAAPEAAAPAATTPAAEPNAAADALPPTAIAALVEQLQRPTPPGAAPPTIGRIAMADPLAPILSLSDDERLALFT